MNNINTTAAHRWQTDRPGAVGDRKGASPEALTVIGADDEPQIRWNEFIRLVRAGHDVHVVGALLGIEGGKFPRS